MAGNLSKLEAVNIVLDAILESAASALDTDGTTPVADAERALDRADKKIQSQGWHFNTEYNVEFPMDNPEIDDTSATGATIAADGVTLTSTGAFADYTYSSSAGAKIKITGGTNVTTGWYEIASKTSDNIIVLSSAITSDATEHTDVSFDSIANPEITLDSDVITADGYGNYEYLDIAIRGQQLYSRYNNTENFDASVYVTLTRLISFANVPYPFQNWIAAQAAFDFHNTNVGDTAKLRTLAAILSDARNDALMYDARTRNTRLQDTVWGQRSRGTNSVYPSMRY